MAMSAPPERGREALRLRERAESIEERGGFAGMLAS